MAELSNALTDFRAELDTFLGWEENTALFCLFVCWFACLFVCLFVCLILLDFVCLFGVFVLFCFVLFWFGLVWFD